MKTLVGQRACRTDGRQHWPATCLSFKISELSCIHIVSVCILLRQCLCNPYLWFRIYIHRFGACGWFLVMQFVISYPRGVRQYFGRRLESRVICVSDPRQKVGRPVRTDPVLKCETIFMVIPLRQKMWSISVRMMGYR